MENNVLSYRHLPLDSERYRTPQNGSSRQIKVETHLQQL